MTTIIATVLMTVSVQTNFTFSCDDPFLAFVNTCGLPGGDGIPRAYVYDEKNPTGKILRVTQYASTFGAAKVSADIERSLACYEWSVRTNSATGRDFYLRKEGEVLAYLKSGDLSYLYTPFADAKSRVLDRTNSLFRICNGTVAELGVGGRPGPLSGRGFYSFFGASGETCFSQVWGKEAVKIPEFDFIKPEEAKEIVTSDVVARTYPFPYGADEDDKYLLYYEGNNNGFWNNIIDYILDGDEDAMYYDAWDAFGEPIITNHYVELLSPYCNTNYFYKQYMAGRFFYDVASASSWQTAIIDAGVVSSRVEGRVPVYHLSFVLEGSAGFNFDPPPYVVHDQAEEAFRVGVGLSGISRGPMTLSVRTNSVGYANIRSREQSVKLSDVCEAITTDISFDVIFSLPASYLRRIIPDGESRDSLLTEFDGFNGVMNVRADDTTGIGVSCSYVGSTNWNVSITTRFYGDCELVGDAGQFVTDDPPCVIPPWADKYVKATTNYYSGCILEHMEWEDDEYGYIEQFESNAVDSCAMFSGVARPNAFVSEYSGMYNKFLLKVDDLAFSKTGINLREKKVIDPFNNEKIRDSIRENCIFSVDETGIIRGVFSNVGGKIYLNGIEIGEDNTFFYRVSDNETDVKKTDDRTFKSTFGCQSAVIYHFSNLRPIWCDTDADGK